MKRKINKALAVIMSCMMAMTFLSGCGNSLQETSPAAEDSAAESEDYEQTDDSTNNASYAKSTDQEATDDLTSESTYDTRDSEETADMAIEDDYENVNEKFQESEQDSRIYPSINNGETYEDYEQNGFELVANKPLSTFSADVDTASYANLRRMIEDNYGIYDIPKGSVRIEELLNYFSYDFKTPKKKDPFAVTTEVSRCPWNEDNYLMMVGMKTSEIDWEDSAPSNLVFLIDVSGSMEDPDKLPLLQQAFTMLTEKLGKDDRVSIVTYASSDEVIIHGVRGNHREEICEAINNLEAGGTTNGSAGIVTAYELAEKYFIKNGNNRVILATDGDLNVGLTSEEELDALISHEKESGVFLSVLGFGTGNINDVNMETLADKGNGNYSYIDSVYEAKKVLVEEMGATLNTVAKDVKLQVEFNPQFVNSYRLIGYENRAMKDTDFNDDKKDAGELGAGHSVVALYEIVLNGGKNGIKLKYQDGTVGGSEVEMRDKDEYGTVSIRYKEPDGEKSKKLAYPIAHKVYHESPSDDFAFASSVAEFGLIVTGNEFAGNAELSHVVESLKNQKLGDEYKQEFYYLVKQLDRR